MHILALICLTTSLVVASVPNDIHLQYASFLGGSLDDTASSVAADSQGNSYIAGTTYSPDFPLTSITFGFPSKDQACAFVTKIDHTGNSIIWSVCLAAAFGDRIAVDRTGAVYVLTHAGPNSTLTKLSPSADRIVYAKPILGSATALAIGQDGSVYITGSAGPDFQTTAGAYQTKLLPGTCHGGAGVGMIPYPCPDVFVTRFNQDGTLAYATFLGGSAPDTGRSIAVDSQGNAWVAGDTVSADFPVTSDALQSRFHGEVNLGPLSFGDAFVAKLDSTGARLLYSTFLGGSAADAATAITVDSLGSAYVAGGTQSSDFPTTPGALQRSYGGGTEMPSLSGGDAFVAKFSATGELVYSTFLGGPLQESATSIAVDVQGSVYVDAYPNVSTVNPIRLSVLSPDGSSIVHSAPVTGSFALDSQGALHYTGQTLGSLFFPSTSAFQRNFGGGIYDATALKIDFSQPTSPWISTIVNAAGMRSGTPSFYPVFDIAPGEIITVFGSGFDTSTKISIDGIAAPVIYLQSDQINAVTPFGISGPVARIAVQSSNQTVGPATMNVFDAVPALFTLDGSGKGQAAALNQDGTINSRENPAIRGSVVSVFMTGAGRMTPQPPDGSVWPISAPFATPVLSVGCNIGQVEYAGAAPGLVAGTVQLNILISTDVRPGSNVPVVVYAGNFASGFTGDTTVAIR
jgi:uncharacterized protein (TIGR03437 family)